MEWVRVMAWKYADGSYDRFEELYSIGMLGLCEGAAGMPVHVSDPVAYLCKSAQYAMFKELRRLHECSTISLDAPLSDKGGLCLADMLSDGSSLPVAPASSKRVRALNGAVRRLASARQRAVVRRMAGLLGYGAHSREETARAVHASPMAAHCLDNEGRRKLRHDARLCKVMGVQA